jgi:uncharacterized protein YbjT (DUF2867 family)
MRIALSGATGFVGGHLARELVRRGHEVRAVVREPRRAGDLAEAGIDVVGGDVLQPDSLEEWLRKTDAVIHLVGIIRESGPLTFHRVHVQGTRNVLDAARAADVREIVHMSALAARTEPGASAYHRTKGEAEEAVRTSGLAWTIIRPSVIFGPGDGFVSMLASLLRYSPAVPMVGRGEFRLQPLWIGDVVEIFVRAVESPDMRGRELEVGGPEQIPYREVLRAIARVQKTRRPLIPFPIPLFRAMAAAGASLRIPAPITPDQLQMLLEENITDRNAAAEVMGREPLGFEEGLRRYL